MRTFEQYILNRSVSSSDGLLPLPVENFLPFPGGFSDASESTSPSSSGTTEAVSDPVELGFSFEFDGTTYTKIVACVAGWCALVDPAETDPENVRDSLLVSGSYSNEGINLTNSSKNVLLCPWFDRVQNKFDISTAQQSDLSNVDPNADVVRERYGFKTPSYAVSTSDVGVKFQRIRDHAGRAFVIRWNVVSATSFITTASADLSFECVIRENGTIEFRYSPKRAISNVAGTVTENATIGIFASGSNRFRDFSPGLGLLDQRRTVYKYGGATYNSGFNDAGFAFFTTSSFKTRSYVWRLRPDQNWPGLDRAGAVFSFSPPAPRRNILPRVELKNESERLSTNSPFDDKRTIVSGKRMVVNYPTTMTRFTDPNSIALNDLFLGGGDEIETTGSLNINAIGKLGIKRTNFFAPFNDSQVNDRLDQISLSSLEFDESFAQSMSAKKHVVLNVPVARKTRLLGTTASIYYLNVRERNWQIPANSITSSNSDIATAGFYVFQTKMPEDHRGFNAAGFVVSSGSNNPGNRSGSFQFMNSDVAYGEVSSILLNDDNVYSKSIFTNPLYSAAADETFSLNIEKPMVVERIVVDVPVECGQTWFNDRTTSFLPLNDNGVLSNTAAFDFGGPGITFAVMNQVTVNGSTKRELIASGTFTHSDDNQKSVVLSNFPPTDSTYQLRPVGFPHYGTPAGIVVPRNGSFTGSVRLTLTPESVNGVTVARQVIMDSIPSANRHELLEIIGRPNLEDFDLFTFPVTRIVNGKPLGRAGDRVQSGRSLFGREFVVADSNMSTVGTKLTSNPFYLTGSAYTAMAASIQSVSDAVAIALSNAAIGMKSPYVVRPGDKLVFSISKHRPHVHSYDVDTSNIQFSGSVEHDVSLITGSVRITLIGSELRNGVVVSPTATEGFTTVSDVIGDDCFDQYEPSTRAELVGTFTDDYVTGTMTSGRSKVFSKFNARNVNKPGVSSDLSSNPMLSFRLKPWFENAGIQHVCQHVDVNERWYDSMMPSIASCFRISNASFSINNDSIVADNSAQLGVMYFNTVQVPSTTTIRPVDNSWMRSFPFEPKYSGITRIMSAETSLVSTISDSGSTYVPIPPVTIAGFIPVLGRDGNGILLNYQLYADVNLNDPDVTVSLSTTDLTKFMFGFGSLNTVHSSSFGANRLIGTNKAPEPLTTKVLNTGTGIEKHTGFGISIRGWKYGVHSAVPLYNKAYFRRGHFGQQRDMLEQRLDGKFIQVYDRALPGKKTSIGTSPIKVKFVNSLGENTQPIRTFSQNLSNECTSSIPYTDAEIRNRPDINLEQQNSAVVFID